MEMFRYLLMLNIVRQQAFFTAGVLWIIAVDPNDAN